MAIVEFQDEYRFLSNFWLCPVKYEGVIYPSAENAYQAAKTHNVGLRSWFSRTKPNQARAYGHKIPAEDFRQDWEEVKEDVMYQVVRSKFGLPEMREKLLELEGFELIEGNRWHDDFWGNCICPRHVATPGQNKLGKILMRIRDEILEAEYYAEHNVPTY